MKQFFVYILASEKYGTLYVGTTGDLPARLHAHKTGLLSGFAKKYHVTRLVYLEEHQTMYDAIQREKRIKEWRRSWKIDLIETKNPQWNDLSNEFYCEENK